MAIPAETGGGGKLRSIKLQDPPCVTTRPGIHSLLERLWVQFYSLFLI